MRVLSLFDGISGAQQALKNLGITPETYYASEIDKFAISVTMRNFPNTIQLGDVTKLHDFDFGEIDLMTWGSPCQDLSIAKKDRQGLNGVRSGLFYDAVKIWQRVKPKYWIMENVASMPKESMHEISKILGTYPVTINSALVTAQQRNRYYWTNIKGTSMFGEIEQPEDRNILLKDILENGSVNNNKSFYIDANYYKGSSLKHSEEKSTRQLVFEDVQPCALRTYPRYKVDNEPREKRLELKDDNKANTLTGTYYDSMVCETIRIGQLNKGGQGERVYSIEGKSVSLSANGGGRGAKTGLYEVEYNVRKLTPIECERLQGFPDNYTYGISNTQRYKCLGNSFTVPVIEHILSFILCQNK